MTDLLWAPSLEPLLEVGVPGEPVPQGSMKLMTSASTGQPFGKYSDRTIEHRNEVVAALVGAWNEAPALDEPVKLRCRFVFPRPKSHYLPANSRRSRPQLRDGAPIWHCQAPDTDKLIRLVCDALTTATVWRDDCLAVDIKGVKIWGASNGATTIQLFRMQ